MLEVGRLTKSGGVGMESPIVSSLAALCKRYKILMREFFSNVGIGMGYSGGNREFLGMNIRDFH